MARDGTDDAQILRMISLAAFTFVVAALFGSVAFAIQQESDLASPSERPNHRTENRGSHSSGHDCRVSSTETHLPRLFHQLDFARTFCTPLKSTKCCGRRLFAFESGDVFAKPGQRNYQVGSARLVKASGGDGQQRVKSANVVRELQQQRVADNLCPSCRAGDSTTARALRVRAS
jgi:hypothetical protein